MTPQYANFFPNITRFLFFTGKGGVGKTSIACATAVKLADEGKKVLLVSTDPASNLDEVLGTTLAQSPTPITAVTGLYAINIDPERAAKDYRDRTIAPLLGKEPEEKLSEIKEQLSGACTTEVATFDEFTSLLSDKDTAQKFDHIIFDTAPTGHTLRLLSLPAAWSDYLATPTHEASCLGPSAAFKNQREQYLAAVETLKDSSRTTIIIVIRPDPLTIAEAERTSAELNDLGLANQQIVINSVFEAIGQDDIALSYERRANEALDNLSPVFNKKVTTQVPLKPYNIVGIASLRRLFTQESPALEQKPEQKDLLSGTIKFSGLIDKLETDGKGLIMVMGKGGVGKTTIASAIAVGLASRGHPVHLTTTDPAAHLEMTLAGSVPNLRVDHIDPKLETQKYTDQIIQSRGKGLDPAALELLKEDLKSPCTEEVAVFRAFTRAVNEAINSFVVIDTAPTGHTLLLLDTAGSYHREVMRSFGGSPEAHHLKVQTPLMRLKNPSYTKIMIVTLAENTPVTEASALQEDLRRAEIEPYAWIVNQSMAITPSTDPILSKRAENELAQLHRIQSGLAARLAIVPWTPDRPVGIEHLTALAKT